MKVFSISKKLVLFQYIVIFIPCKNKIKCNMIQQKLLNFYLNNIIFLHKKVNQA